MSPESPSGGWDAASAPARGGPGAPRAVVACGADAAYVMPLAVTLTSLVEHLGRDRPLDAYVVDGGLGEGDRARLARSLERGAVRLRWLSPERARVRGLPVWGRLSPSVYQRLLLPELLGEEEKAIWLDCDVVVQADVGRLWDLPIEDRDVLAAQDMIVPYVSSAMGVARHAELGIPPEAKYFNAGVMVVNLARWRERDVTGRVVHYLRSYRRDVVFLEQEGLNAVLAGGWGELDGRWNHNASVAGRPFFRARHLDPETYARIVADPWITHFSGNIKPWTARRPTAQRELYFRYLDRTPWSGWRPAPSILRSLVGSYESSRVRRALYPTERWALELVRRVSRDRNGARLARALRER